jgi:hypothetical protein
MTEKRYVAPEGMLKAAIDAQWNESGAHPSARKILAAEEAVKSCVKAGLEAALRWLSENPIVPTDGETKRIWRDTGLCNEVDDSELQCIAAEWQRRMFLAPEPEVSEEIKDLLLPNIECGFFKPEVVNERMIECYRRGQKAGAK